MPTIYSKRRGTPPAPFGAISVDRSTPFGKRFIMHQERDRDAVCDAFEGYAGERLTRTDHEAGDALSSPCQCRHDPPRLSRAA